VNTHEQKILDIKENMKTMRSRLRVEAERQIALSMAAEQVKLSTAVREAMAHGTSRSKARNLSGRTSADLFRNLLSLTEDYAAGIEETASRPAFDLVYIKPVWDYQDKVWQAHFTFEGEDLWLYPDEDPVHNIDNWNDTNWKVAYGKGFSRFEHPDRVAIVTEALRLYRENPGTEGQK
jgi:hypothetical protein